MHCRYHSIYVEGFCKAQAVSNCNCLASGLVGNGQMAVGLWLSYEYRLVSICGFWRDCLADRTLYNELPVDKSSNDKSGEEFAFRIEIKIK